MFQFIYLQITLLALLGLGIGSFVNAAVLRINAADTLWGRSRCPHCQTTLPWYTLIPVLSYLGLRGACLFCQQPIAYHYPLIEAVTASLFGLAGLWYAAEPLQLAVTCLVITACVAIFLSDYLFSTIPDAISLPALLGITVGQWLLGKPWWQIILGIAVGGGVFTLQYLLSRGRWIGSGDIRLGAMIGAAVLWPNILASLFIAYVGGALVAIPLLLRRQKRLHDALPFGTFLAIGCLVTLFFGDAMVSWYVYDLLTLPN